MSAKLIYFNFRGRGEASRLIFAAAGIDYEDKRVEWQSQEWFDFRDSEKCPFLELPVLELSDGTVISEGRAISRYLAKEHGLHGKTNRQSATVDMVVDAVEDLHINLVNYNFGTDQEQKDKLGVEIKEKLVPRYLGGLEKLLVSNNGGNGYFVGNSVTVADLALFSVTDNLPKLPEGDRILAQYPKLLALKKRVEEIPRIAAWLKKRPETIF